MEIHLGCPPYYVIDFELSAWRTSCAAGVSGVVVGPRGRRGTSKEEHANGVHSSWTVILSVVAPYTLPLPPRFLPASPPTPGGLGTLLGNPSSQSTGVGRERWDERTVEGGCSVEAIILTYKLNSSVLESIFATWDFDSTMATPRSRGQRGRGRVASSHAIMSRVYKWGEWTPRETLDRLGWSIHSEA